MQRTSRVELSHKFETAAMENEWNVLLTMSGQPESVERHAIRKPTSEGSTHVYGVHRSTRDTKVVAEVRIKIQR